MTKKMIAAASTPRSLWAIACLLAIAALLFGASEELRAVASRTGVLAGGFSLKWGAAYVAFLAVSLSCLIGIAVVGWNIELTARIVASVRHRSLGLGRWRWLLLTAGVVLPAWILQYSPWGVVFDGPFTRILIWCLAALTIAWSLPSGARLADAAVRVLIGFMAAGTSFAVTAAFTQVTSYPFSLGWSEGNRLWDYSLLFGRHLYTYTVGHEPVAYLDVGRQFIGGLPFLLPSVSIFGERSWLAVMAVGPYVLLGLALFRPNDGRSVGVATLSAVWTFLFLSQGPIHAPILFSAIIVVLAVRRPLWLAVCLLFVAGYVAEISRFTWLLAPAAWGFMLEFIGGGKGGASSGRVWLRASALGVSGLLGALVASAGFGAGGAQIGTSVAASTGQALLWYRLLPNATYGSGILVGVLIAVGPSALLLVWLCAGRWRLDFLQILALVAAAVGFLAVGLVVSTKIGGGGDLHNLDMFLITFVIIVALAWSSIGAQWSSAFAAMGPWAQSCLILAMALPAFHPLMSLRPLDFDKDTTWLAVLKDVQRPRDLGSLPSSSVVHSSLHQLQTSVADALDRGEVLFMDQRQLFTFGQMPKVLLVPEFEKKRMMDEALSGNIAYFEPFYADLAKHRFSMIVTSPLRTPIRDTDYGFGEENNAWVTWVAKPILCFYAEQDTLNEVKVELLTPRTDAPDCSTALPAGLR